MPPRPKPSTHPSATHVALLRGINVGGNNILPMAALTEIFTNAGCKNVRTYIQSGNIVFTTTAAAAQRVPRLTMQAIKERFGIQPPIIIRTAAELHRVVANNPFPAVAPETGALHVAFLADAPDKQRIAALDPNRSPGDSFKLIGREIYLLLTGGVAGTKLTNNYFDSTLATISTARNWRTVLRLVEMTQPGD